MTAQSQTTFLGPTAVGLDLSLTASGICLPDGRTGLVGKAGITNMAVREQMDVIKALAAAIIDQVLPHVDYDGVVVVEALDMGQSYGGQIERTVLWWEVVDTLHQRGLRVATPTSGQVKKYATGNGNAKKGTVIEAVTRQWPHLQHGGNDNRADAAAMYALGMALLGRPLSTLPKTHTSVVPAIRYTTDPPPPKKAKR